MDNEYIKFVIDSVSESEIRLVGVVVRPFEVSFLTGNPLVVEMTTEHGRTKRHGIGFVINREHFESIHKMIRLMGEMSKILEPRLFDFVSDLKKHGHELGEIKTASDVWKVLDFKCIHVSGDFSEQPEDGVECDYGWMVNYALKGDDEHWVRVSVKNGLVDDVSL